jgi:hypothetical protein
MSDESFADLKKALKDALALSVTRIQVPAYPTRHKTCALAKANQANKYDKVSPLDE